MKVSLKWLNEYVSVPSDIKELCDRFDLTGTGVEGVEKLGELYEQVVTGKVVEKKRHPNADTLWLTRVDVGECNLNDQGEPEPLQIICGAQNFEQGDHIIVALVGSVLPGGVEIKKSKLRGELSFGMNCSSSELGLGAESDGIMILPKDTPVGMPLADYLDRGDTVLDLEVTPNRPDCLSVLGIARELAAMYGIDFTKPGFNLVESDEPAEKYVSVSIENPERCKRYTARVIKDIKVGPSPDWLVERLSAIGSRPINNVVDVTNYLMFLLGQPFHAFDYDALKNSDDKAHIVVRAAQEGEKLTTLDGEERTLKEDMTLIATPERAVGLAGVMGGLETEVSDSTTTVLLESATFNPAHTSRTSRNLGLISESSIRFERGVDDNSVACNGDMAAALLAELCGGQVCAGRVDVWNERTEAKTLPFRIERFQKFVGEDIPREFIVDTLSRLGCEVSETAPGSAKNDTASEEADAAENLSNALQVIAPSFRPDLEREIDLYEEVLRIYGMDRIPATLPAGRGRVGERSLTERKLDLIHASLRSSGLNETMTYSFSNPQDLEKLGMDTEDLGLAIELLNPINADQSIMRQSIIPGLLHSVVYNQSHEVKNIQLYEIGSVFIGSSGKKQPKERQKVAGVLAGSMQDKAWNRDDPSFDFFDGKGIVENLMRELAIPKVRFKPLSTEEAPYLQPGRAAEVWSAGALLGWVGELHPLAVEAFDASAPVVAFELDLSSLVKTSQPARDYIDIPHYPAVTMDLALVVDEEVTHERLMQCMRSAGGNLLEEVKLFDVYRDEEKLGLGKKSMAYALSYRANDKTLTSKEVDKAHARLVKKVTAATKAEVRS